MLDPDRLGGGDLDVIDVVAIPDRLEDAIGEAQDQHVLDGLFAEVVVDAVDLVLAQVPVQGGVELARRLQVAAERLFDDDAAPPVALDGQAGGGQRVDQAGVGLRRRGQVEEQIGRAAVSADFRQAASEAAQLFVDGEITFQVVQPGGEGAPGGLVEQLRGERLQPLAGLLAERVVRGGAARHAQQAEAFRKPSLAVQFEQGRDQFPPGEITRGAEDHQGRCRVHGAARVIVLF